MADTINTGTMLIEEGLLPASLRFESEPWTFFYMAGERIRELRKALENKASTRAKATWLFLTLWVLLSSYLPARAQTRSAQLSLMQEGPAPRMTLLAAASSPLPLTTFLPGRPLAERPARFTALLAAVYNRDRSPEGLSSVEVLKTPFVRQARVTLVQLWSGRLQLGGFISARRMENVLLGYSASGDLPGFGVSRQGHPGARVPRADRSYGLSLTFRLGCDAHAERRVE